MDVAESQWLGLKDQNPIFETFPRCTCNPIKEPFRFIRDATNEIERYNFVLQVKIQQLNFQT